MEDARMAKKDEILVIGAREHNLKSVTVSIPKDKLTVITGPSGSGKSSLALDTVYAEGRRRYVESLSSYARQFLGVSKRPDVDRIDGLCPAIAIDQKSVGFNPRSTVGTITEIYDYLRVLFARIGIPHCPNCHEEIKEQSPQDICTMLLASCSKKTIYIAAPLAIEKKGEFKTDLMSAFDQTLYRFLIDGKMVKFKSLEEIANFHIAKTTKHTIYVLLDHLEVNQAEAQRVQEGIEKAFAITGGLCSIIEGEEGGTTYTYSSLRVCLKCARSCPELEPRLFSFNSPVGACPRCHGLGVEYNWKLHEEMHSFSRADILQEEHIECSVCNGSRLRPEALAVTVGKKNIHEVATLSVDKAIQFCKTLSLSEEQAQIASSLLHEIRNRLQFLDNVGLNYLTLSRTARTLSGGENQRIRLATQIGSALSGVIYILDEPSIGLHQRDNDRLIETLKLLRDLGNTVLVVEHDMDTIRAADYLIDMGPGAGNFGGEVTAFGTPEQVANNKNSLTGEFLSGKRAIKVPKKRRVPIGYLSIKNVTTNNLKHLNVEIPLGVFAAVSGVSGSGKSSLIVQTLAPTLQQYFFHGYHGTKNFDELLGLEQLSNVVVVDQSPIGRTPRSNPATYLGIFDDIRTLFASLPESQARGYTGGRFSFNVAQGRCFECSGEGQIKVSMHFLEDVCMTCKVCKGTRYNQQTLEIQFKGKNIAEILAMTIHDACEFFANYTTVFKRLQLLKEVGLDYLTLGQPSTTLSGGEAQRIKLVNELAKRGKNTLYILDEPTTGLHSIDVERLLEVLNRLIDRGNSVLVIEHNLDVLKVVDYLIDIGPEGGDAGGFIVAQGTPEEVADCVESFTGNYLKTVL